MFELFYSSNNFLKNSQYFLFMNKYCCSLCKWQSYYLLYTDIEDRYSNEQYIKSFYLDEVAFYKKLISVITGYRDAEKEESGWNNDVKLYENALKRVEDFLKEHREICKNFCREKGIKVKEDDGDDGDDIDVEEAKKQFKLDENYHRSPYSKIEFF